MNTLQTIIVCGSRNGSPFGEVEKAMRYAQEHEAIPPFNHVVVGSRRGVDRRAFDWAETFELAATVVPARWTTGGQKRAEGPIRNRRMLAYFPDVRAVLAFPGGSGTEDMVAAAKEAGVKVWRWRNGWTRDP
jgi:hypothetical protein